MIRKYQNAEPQRSNEQHKELVDSMVSLAVHGLRDMFIDEGNEFALKKKKLGKKVVTEGRNLRYTLICLIGLYKAECNGFEIKINLQKIIKQKIKRIDKLEGVGDIGLLLWATSLISPDQLLNILTRINFKDILNVYNDAKSNLTMELSWLLTGLLMASTFNEIFKKSIENLPEKVFNSIRKNYGGSGIFRHQDDTKISGKFRGSIGSFADQVYPIYAFSLYAKIKNNDEALLVANECANTLCNHQGQNGEWLWHYDSRDGNIISKYPVYSVHQDAMAPMALYAVQKATGINYEDFIFKGLNWLVENPENIDMIDFNNNLIYRCIAPPSSHRKIKSTLAHLGINTKEEYKNLEVTEECWSYHLGWLLHAFAGRGNKIGSNLDHSDYDANKLKLYSIK